MPSEEFAQTSKGRNYGTLRLSAKLSAFEVDHLLDQLDLIIYVIEDQVAVATGPATSSKVECLRERRPKRKGNEPIQNL